MSVASHRLIDAAAKLPPGDRALLSLLINHGLGEGALARALHADPGEIGARRQQLAERLGMLLEVPAAEVRNALDELAGAARAQRVATETAAPEPTGGLGNGVPELRLPTEPDPATPGQVSGSPAAETTAETSAKTPPAAGRTPTAPDAGRTTPPTAVQQRRRRTVAVLALAIAAIVVLIIALASGGSHRRVASSTAAAPPTTAASTTSPTSTAPTTTTAAGTIDARTALGSLPGGPTGAAGTVKLTGPSNTPQLALMISGLPPAGSGHYEVWLYNSVIDSRAVGTLDVSTGGSLTATLPAGYRHYQWLDVSLQPAGTTAHSGESALRAAVPR